MNDKKSSGLLNKLIDKLPVELHIPSYHYCGPGTKLSKRLARGDQGKDKLDLACKNHDISYNNYHDLENRRIADKILYKEAIERMRASDSRLSEKAAALTVALAMKAKRKLGFGLRSRRKNRRSKKNKNLSSSIIVAPREIPTVKKGGFLPLLPTLSALGSLTAAASSIIRTVNSFKSKQQQNKSGQGFYLKNYKKGSGLRKKRKSLRKKNK